MRKGLMSFLTLLLFFVLIGTTSTYAEDVDGSKTLVFHYLRFDGEYDNVGIHLWETGAGGDTETKAKDGVDEFGAYFEIKIGPGATTVGTIPLGDISDDSKKWDTKATFGGANLMIDVSYLFTEVDGETPDEMHVYFMENGDSVLHLEKEDDLNYIFVVYAEESARYEGWGLHIWGTGERGTSTAWGTFHPYEATAYTKENGFPIKLAAFAVDSDASENIGIISTNGSEQTDDIMVPSATVIEKGEQVIYYIYNQKGTVENDTFMTDPEDFFAIANDYQMEFKFIPYDAEAERIGDRGTHAVSPTMIQVQFNLEVVVQEEDENGLRVPSDKFSEDFFTLKDSDGKTIAIEVIHLDTLATTDFTILFKDENFKLDHTKTYTLTFDNGLEGFDGRQAEIEVDIDKEAPEINLVGNTVIEIKQYERFNFPDYAARDNRDGTITRRVYVPTGKGSLDTGVVGDHKITLAVEDNWGHLTELEFTVRVVAVETEDSGPSIGLIIGIVAGVLVVAGGVTAGVLYKKKSS